MASGLSVTDECLEAYREMKNLQKYNYVIYKISDDFKEVIVAEKAVKNETYYNFVKCVMSYGVNCLYAVFDFKHTINDKAVRQLVFVVWAPDHAKIKEKMVYVSSKDDLKLKLDGINVDLQANDYSGLEMDVVLSKCEKSQ